MVKQNRKKFLLAGLGLAGVAAFFKTEKQPKIKNTTKFLTQDGRLVEIDTNKLPTTKLVASKLDIQNWIKK
ncbi:MAG: hypothetical protein JJE09_01175 [Bacteroidia bacterium]|nr:hypothetical protein [Bacteroidia bacterium]